MYLAKALIVNDKKKWATQRHSCIFIDNPSSLSYFYTHQGNFTERKFGIL